MKSFFVKIFSAFAIVLFVSNFLFAPESFAKPKSLKTVPKRVVISVSEIPENLVALVVPLTFNAALVNILSVESNVDGALAVFSQGGVGILQTSGNLPSMFDFSVTFKGLKRGRTNFSTGEVVDKLGGTPIQGAVASTKTKKLKVK